jgi:hypothetical protein
VLPRVFWKILIRGHSYKNGKSFLQKKGNKSREKNDIENNNLVKNDDIKNANKK